MVWLRVEDYLPSRDSKNPSADPTAGETVRYMGTCIKSRQNSAYQEEKNCSCSTLEHGEVARLDRIACCVLFVGVQDVGLE